MAGEALTPAADTAKLTTAPGKVSRILYWGAGAAVAAGAISAVGAAIDAVQGEQNGFSVSTALALVALVPSFVMLVAFVSMIRALDPVELNSLRRSGICLFGLLVLLTAADTLMSSFPQPGRATPLLVLILGVGSLVLFLYAFGIGSWSVFVLMYFAIRYGAGWLLDGKRMDGMAALIVTALAITTITAIVCSLRFAFQLILSRARLGLAAEGLAVLVLMALLAVFAFGIWMSVVVVAAPNANKMSEQEIDALLSPYMRLFNIVGVFFELASALCIAGLFLGVRKRLAAPAGEPAT